MKDKISIEDETVIAPSTCYASLTHGSLFSGIGGFDLASEWMGWENIFHCELNDFGKRILKYYWPNVFAIRRLGQKFPKLRAKTQTFG